MRHAPKQIQKTSFRWRWTHQVCMRSQRLRERAWGFCIILLWDSSRRSISNQAPISKNSPPFKSSLMR